VLASSTSTSATTATILLPTKAVMDGESQLLHFPRRRTQQQQQQHQWHVVNDFSSRRGVLMLRGGGDDSSEISNDDDDDLLEDDDASILIRGGGKGLDTSNNKSSSNKTSNNSVSITTLLSSPRTLAALSMATCMSLHYLAYSLARPATMTLFTSSRLGFGGDGGGSVSSAYPLAMTFIGPASFVLLLLYGIALDAGGPYGALKSTTLGCASILGLSALVIDRMDAMIPNDVEVRTASSWHHHLGNLLIHVH
jgi:hypothetical protein